MDTVVSVVSVVSRVRRLPDAARGIHTRYAAMLLASTLTLTLLLSACTHAAGSGGQPGGGGASGSATATVSVSPANCAAALPGSGPINLQSSGFVYPITFPSNTVGTAVQQVVSGTGLFTVAQFNACSPDTSVSDVQAFYAAQLPALQHGWISTNLFPADGGLMTSCGQACWYDPKGGPFYYLIFDQYTNRGNGIVTYRARYAISPSNGPNCGANFAGTPEAQDNIFFVPGSSPAFPLPPLSDTVVDDASGGVKGYDVCSYGTTTSISSFLLKELPASGWAKIDGSDPHCIYSDECWKNGGEIVSWSVTGFSATDWHVAWREPLS